MVKPLNINEKRADKPINICPLIQVGFGVLVGFVLSQSPQSETTLLTTPSSSTSVVDTSIDLETARKLVPRCVEMSAESKAHIMKEIKYYEADKQFREKIQEVEKNRLLAIHIAIRDFLKTKVLQPGWSIMELGCAAGIMLQVVKEAYEQADGGIGKHGPVVGVELVTGWAKFGETYHKPRGIDVYEGDITQFSLPAPYTNSTFDFIMLNDVAEHIQHDRYGCFFSQLQKVTHPGSIIYMHTPNPQGQLIEKGQYYENVLPHHYLISGMALAGFELILLEQDIGVICGARKASLSPKFLNRVPCSYNNWPRYYNVLFRRVDEAKYDVFNLQ